jgi:hypothetical protein
MSRVDFGQVEVQLDDVVTLKPTLRAFEKISNRFGGLRNAIQALSNMDIDSVAFIIAAASGVNGTKAMDSLKEQIFTAGVVKVMPKVTEYLVLLMNPSGKDEEPEDDEGK